MEVVIGFSMLKKQRRKHRRGQDMSKKTEHAEVQKETCRKSKERRKKTEVERKEKGPKLHAAW